MVWGVAGFERRASDPAFTESEANAAVLRVPCLAAIARARVEMQRAMRELQARVAIDQPRMVLLVDRERKCVEWCGGGP